MATYVNDLRLKEIATGDEAGTWGTSTNTNLELIGEALGYGTQDCFASDADATTTVADGASDPARAMYFKVTSSATLTATRTLTIAPNTISRVMLIENATTGSQSITISQGSGSTVTIASGAVKMVYLDGAGAGGAVVEALADLELPTVTVADLTATTADINGGTIDGTVIGGSTPAAVTTSSLVATTADINAGTIDGTVIGGSSAAAITGTTITGTSFVSSGDMTFGDNDKAVFGAGSDLQIYHDGSASYIDDAGTGNLRIRANSSLSIQKYTGETMGVFTADGSVMLAHDNVQKFETTATGIDVTGTVTADSASVTGDAYVQTADGASAFYVTRYGTIISESAKFHIDDNDLIIDSIQDEQFGGITFKSTLSGTGTRNRLDIANNGDISFYEDTGTTAKFFWDASAESLGIGTIPTVALQVSGQIKNNNGYLIDNGTNAGFLTVDGSNVNFGSSTAAKGLAFFTAASSQAMTIDASGNVGIGETSPSTYGKLVVTGSTPFAVVRSSDTTSAGFSMLVNSGSNGVGSIATDNGGHMTFDTGSTGAGQTERMRIDSSGNLGLGVTPSAWSSASRPAFQLPNGAALFSRSGTTFLSQNFFYNSSDTGTYIANGFATLYNQTSGKHQWFNAPSGTAGNTAALTQAMTLDASGNLLVGTTQHRPANNNVNGVSIDATYGLETSVTSGGAITANRKSTDGTIIELQKDGTTVGSIGTYSGDLWIGQGNTGLLFNDGGDVLRPANASGGNRDGIYDLGASDSRFKDLYLSGGVYLGGTGAANHLDDYEEGTWTPTIVGSSTAGTYTYSNGFATYTKVGRRVTVGMFITGITEVSAGSGYLVIGGVPFAKMADAQFTGAVRTEQVDLGTSNTFAIVEFTTASLSGSSLYIRGIQNNASGSDVGISGITSGSSIIGLSITYFTS